MIAERAYFEGLYMSYRIIALVALAFIVSLLGLVESVHAQTYPCGNGPGPGERQVGTMGGSHGVASIPICEATGQVGQGSDKRPVKFYPITNFMVVASHPDQSDVWATWGQHNRGAAELVVLDACEKTMGGGCRILHSGYNMAVAIGRDAKGQLRTAQAATPKQAENELTAKCEAEGLTCKMERRFHGPRLSVSAKATSAELERDDREGHTKKYYFPAMSAVKMPAKGTPDAGVGACIGGCVPKERDPLELTGIRNVHISANGNWLLRVGDQNGQGCSLTYALKDQRVLFFGPTQTSKYGALMLTSKALPATIESRETSVAMTGDKGTANVRVFHMPAGEGAGSFIIMPTDIAQTVASLSDKSPVKIVLDGKTILDMQIEGGLKARTAMQQCMAKR